MIKVSDLWTEVKKVAAEQPDYVYPEPYCQYQYGGKPSCLVGHALHRLGVPVDTLAELDTEGGTTALRLPEARPDLLEVDSELDLIELSGAQESQDEGVPWGEAVGGVQ